MTKLFVLTNPNGTLVKSAWISESDTGAVLNVETVYGNDMIGTTTLRGAKQIFGREFQLGGKWDERASAHE